MTAISVARRPFLLRALPPRARQSLLARYYRSRASRWQELYAAAPLRLAPQYVLRGLRPGDVISDSIAFTGVYEDVLSRHLVDRAKDGGLFVDVGANLGYMSLLWVGARADNAAIAIEASSRVYSMLQANVTANAAHDRIDCVNGAAGREAGRMAFDPGPEDQTGWGGLTLDAGAQGREVDVFRLDERLATVESIALLKIDVEGADTWVLQGAEALLERKAIREIWFEENRPRMAALGIEPGTAARLLDRCGYDVVRMSSGSGALHDWRAVPRG